MLISKSRYLSLFNVFFFLTKYFIIFGKDTDQGHRGLARTKDYILYLSKFLQDLSELSEPLRRLTHKKTEWNWTYEQENAFEKITDAVSKAPVLK